MDSAYPGKGYVCATPKVFSIEKSIIRLSKAFFTLVEWAEPTLHDHGVSYVQINTCSFTEIWKIILFIHARQRFMFALRMCWFQRDWSWTVGTGITPGEGSGELICFAFLVLWSVHLVPPYLQSFTVPLSKRKQREFLLHYYFFPFWVLHPRMYKLSPLCRAVCFSIYFIKCVVSASSIVVC